MTLYFYMVNWKDITRLFNTEFTKYLSFDAKNEVFEYEKPNQNWITYLEVPISLKKFGRSHQAQQCFDWNRAKILDKKIHDNLSFIIDITFGYGNDDFVPIDFPKNYPTNALLEGKLISPHSIFLVLQMWANDDYLAFLKKIYQHPENLRYLANFEDFGHYFNNWIDVLRSMPKNKALYLYWN